MNKKTNVRCHLYLTLICLLDTDFGTQQTPHRVWFCLKLGHVWLRLVDVSSKTNLCHLDAHCSFTGRPGASSSNGQDTRPVMRTSRNSQLRRKSRCAFEFFSELWKLLVLTSRNVLERNFWREANVHKKSLRVLVFCNVLHIKSAFMEHANVFRWTKHIPLQQMNWSWGSFTAVRPEDSYTVSRWNSKQTLCWTRGCKSCWMSWVVEEFSDTV